MRNVLRGVALVTVLVVLGGVVVWWATRRPVKPSPGCVVAVVSDAGAMSTDPAAGAFELTPEQAGNAATIAAVGAKMGMPDHAVSVALATALQESRLVNLPGGDRDSAGLFQQRPSQGWGTYAQITDPVAASTAFYRHLSAQAGWTQLSVTQAAQLVQHSAAPQAYAQWEDEARAIAVALTGEAPATLSCHDLTITGPTADLARTADAEWGTGKLSGPHNLARDWAIGSWLVAHAAGLGVDSVTVDGRTWTADSGKWSETSAADGTVALHQATVSRS
ncbi:hypothetical protein [Amycolatopsis pigmentata]|uniref:Cobalt transporter n=1 Tax=Amycolatopsis pigmentata TaxID=450801 RepID=A0ABW5FNI7_9PSEU